ncbi:MAG: hypothetical protein HQL94_03210 [Magnetococcales bacterium]|nr:hypothetical protein [Magnetococcales bacterium]MBF0438003.1 hypothetical protein [Magnetococcales bacterium]
MLTRGLMILGFSLLLDVGLITVGWYYNDDAEVSLEELQKKIASLRAQLKKQENQSQILAMMQPKYDALRQLGAIGPEPRLQWVEALHEAETTLKLPTPIRYKLDPIRLYTPPFPLPQGQGFQLYASRMELTLGLVHEGDLFDLMDFLEKKKVGFFQFTQCKLDTMTNEPLEGKKLKAGVNLKGMCLLEWFTFQSMDNKTS